MMTEDFCTRVQGAATEGLACGRCAAMVLYGLYFVMQSAAMSRPHTLYSHEISFSILSSGTENSAVKMGVKGLL
jgi:hypothetical protein